MRDFWQFVQKNSCQGMTKIECLLHADRFLTRNFLARPKNHWARHPDELENFLFYWQHFTFLYITNFCGAYNESVLHSLVKAEVAPWNGNAETSSLFEIETDLLELVSSLEDKATLQEAVLIEYANEIRPQLWATVRANYKIAFFAKKSPPPF